MNNEIELNDGITENNAVSNDISVKIVIYITATSTP